MAKASTMDETFRIGKLRVKNRLVRSATFEFGAENGTITDRVIELNRALAKGGSGLIISGMMGVRHGGSVGPVMVECDASGFVAGMARIVETVHQNDTLFFAQLNHGGYRTCQAEGYDRIGVSESEVAPGCVYHEATPEEIADIVAAFGTAAARCREAGCDGVQIHAGHGYLLNTFLSPYYNHRRDDYGGPIANRARLLFEVYDAVRQAVDRDFPVAVKLPFSDRVSPSITPEECIFVCKELEKRGIDLIEVTSGISYDGKSTSFSPFLKDGKEGTFLDGAVQVAKAVKVPVVSVGGFRTPDYIEKALNETQVAAVALCRPLIREPDLPNRWKNDRSKAACISCNRCFKSRGIVACQVLKDQTQK